MNTTHTAEKSLIGSMLLAPDVLDELSVRQEDFDDDRHQTIVRTLRELHDERTPIDSVTIATRLDESGTLEDAGGVRYLAELLEAVPHHHHWRSYEATVRKEAQRRQIIKQARRALYEAESGEPQEVIAQLETSLQALRERSTGGDIITIDEAVDAMEERKANPAAITPTGLPDIDRMLRGGFRSGQFVISAGRPGSGKSVFLGQTAVHAARAGKPALIVSLEMDRSEMAERFITSVDTKALRRLPIVLTDTVFEASKIAAVIRQARRKHGVQIVGLDYLQLTEAGDRKASRERQVAEVSRMCKRLAGELKIPIVAGCQLNRQSEAEKRLPRLSDLRESGSIEQDADIVILLHQEGDGVAKAIIGKQRNGSTGVVPLTFRGEKFRFESRSEFDGYSFGSDPS